MPLNRKCAQSCCSSSRDREYFSVARAMMDIANDRNVVDVIARLFSCYDYFKLLMSNDDGNNSDNFDCANDPVVLLPSNKCAMNM